MEQRTSSMEVIDTCKTIVNKDHMVDCIAASIIAHSSQWNLISQMPMELSAHVVHLLMSHPDIPTQTLNRIWSSSPLHSRSQSQNGKVASDMHVMAFNVGVSMHQQLPRYVK